MTYNARFFFCDFKLPTVESDLNSALEFYVGSLLLVIPCTKDQQFTYGVVSEGSPLRKVCGNYAETLRKLARAKRNVLFLSGTQSTVARVRLQPVLLS